MYEPNVQRLLGELKPGDLVLDVGGWACPFNRAQWILDSQPYETRGFYRTFGGKAYQGGEQEWFTRDTWVVRDICDREPWPFADGQFDFVVCSHTLEDIRDPLWVCHELMRVGRRGYIEVPSRAWETCRGMEEGIVGLSHHRWLIEIGDNEIAFIPKFHSIHAHWRFSFPASYLRQMSERDAVQWLWWDRPFAVREIGIDGTEARHALLESYVQRVRPYSSLRLGASAAWRKARFQHARVAGYLRRRLFGNRQRR